MTGAGSLVIDALRHARLLLTDQKHEQVRREAHATGVNLLPRALSADSLTTMRELGQTLGLASPVLPRILGFGWQEAAGLAALAGTPSSFRPAVAHAGALFNLGIALFDHVADRFPEKAARLFETVTPQFLQARLADDNRPVRTTGDPAVDLLVALIVEFFGRCRALGGDAGHQRAVAHTIFAMYGAEKFVSTTRRTAGRPSRRMWRELWRKSALPMTLMGQLALLPEPHAGEDRRTAARLAAALAGEAIWIVDDLADVREDWDAGCWSRPLWLLARRGGRAPKDADDAVRLVVDSHIAAAEARRLAVKLGRLRNVAEEQGAPFVRSIQATVHSWIELMPD